VLPVSCHLTWLRPNPPLQALNCVPELVSWLLSQKASMRGKVAPAYAELIASMWGSSGGAVSPSAFVRKIASIDRRWGDGSQQDAQVCVCVYNRPAASRKATIMPATLVSTPIRFLLCAAATA
jgi:hypothetical protein